MPDKQLHLRVLTPVKTALDQAVDYVILRTSEGDMGILPGHIPCTILLSPGLLKVYRQKTESGILAVMGGFAMVRDNEVTVLSDLAEPPDRVEAELERRKQERLENQGREQRSEVEIHRAEMALRRALLGVDFGALNITDTLEHRDQDDEQP